MRAVYIPVGATGHVLASLPMVGELVARGVEVLYFAPERYRVAVEGTGASFCAMPAIAAGGGSVSAGEDFLASLPLVFLGEAMGVVDTVMPACEAFAPDVVLSDELALCGRLVAAKMKLPLVMVFTSYAPCEQFSICRFWPRYPDTHPARAKAHALAQELTQVYGVRHLDIYEIFEGRGDFNVSTLTREFQPAGDSFGADFLFAGAQIAPRADAPRWQPPGDGKPVLYTSLGSLFTNWPEFYQTLFPIVEKMDIHVVCATGGLKTVGEPCRVPQNVQLLPFAPQLEILPHASAFITHAGTGSAMEALYHGVPCVCLPQMEEQQLTARRLMEMGGAAAFIHRPELTGELLEHAIVTALYDSEVRERARKAALRTRAGSSPAYAAQGIINFMALRL